MRLVLDAVSRWYGNVVAVNDVTMEIGPGVTGLLGPNGAGKSTLIHMMSGFLAPSSGTVTLDGEPTWHNPGIYRHIGLVPEREGAYDGLTGRRFVLANARLHKLPDPEAAAERAIATVDMAAAQDRDVGTYSKGMKQRIKMATALVHDPAVLLLDEPTEGIQPNIIKDIARVIRLLARERNFAVVLVEQYFEFARDLADRIVVMVRGEVALAGAPEALDEAEVRRHLTV